MTNSEIDAALIEAADKNYKAFMDKLKAGEGPSLGVRMPEIRSLAARLLKRNPECFLRELFTVENAFFCREKTAVAIIVLAGLKDCPVSVKIAYVKKLLPHIDGWALCDLLGGELRFFRNAVLSADDEKSEFLFELLGSERTWDVRLALVIFLNHYRSREEIRLVLSVFFTDSLFRKAAKDYYVSMGAAWCLSVFFATERELTESFLSDAALSERADMTTLFRTISKIKDSGRIPSDAKKRIAARILSRNKVSSWHNVGKTNHSVRTTNDR